jgi:hypothetical protein
VTTKCKLRGCTNKCKRRGQEYCTPEHRKAAWNGTLKRRLTGVPTENEKAVQNGLFSLIESMAQNGTPNPLSFGAPDGTKLKVWLGHDKDSGERKVGDDRRWRLSIEEVARQGKKRPVTKWNPTAAALNRPIIVVGRNGPIRDMDDALGVVKGFRVRLCIEDEKELQILGCGRRIVTCQFRGKHVLLHHNGNTAKMKREAFQAFLAANKKLPRTKRTVRAKPAAPWPPLVPYSAPFHREVLKKDGTVVSKRSCQTISDDYPDLPAFLDRRRKLRLVVDNPPKNTGKEEAA